jgi:glycogen operon protein
MKLSVEPGRPLPLGVQDCCDGFNFAVFSRHAERVELLIFDNTASVEPLSRFDLDRAHHRTGDIWHALVNGVRWGQAYAYCMHGPWAPEQGHRFDGKAVLLDPYALAIAVPVPGNGRCLLVNRRFDWQGTTRPRIPWSETVIYETHVRGLTIDPSANSAHPGTFLGLIDKIPYFRDLGVTALELMPVQEFDEPIELSGNTSLRNYWGYNPVSFFAPHRGYATGAHSATPIDEFKTMVRELHRAGIEVILDIVFNHTAEGNENGRLYNFRGIDNPIYYLLSSGGEYLNFSGCGNTVNCNHPVVRDMIVDCLRYWETEMHIDGFRFDLASILGRDETGGLSANPPLLESIAEDPILRDVKLIAEAWDAGGAYQVGSFPGQRWAEWNGRFRDDVRRFWRGDPGMTGALASRLCGSADLYQKSGKEPINSINFVSCHDGFTLADAVSYAAKHNEENGEDNRDGAAENFSANYGSEGPTDDPEIERTRLKQIKNMLATLLLSRGVPMLLGGDEFSRTQRGNNNAYCQDNDISWYDWRLIEQNAELLRFVRELIAFRKRNPVLCADAFYTERDLEWFGPAGQSPDWDGPTRAVGCLVRSAADGEGRRSLCLFFNAGKAPVEFRLPASPPAGWRIAIDTGNPAPADIFPSGSESALPNLTKHQAGPRSLAVLSSM